jgi:RNA polymerase primary sigma factor
VNVSRDTLVDSSHFPIPKEQAMRVDAEDDVPAPETEELTKNDLGYYFRLMDRFPPLRETSDFDRLYAQYCAGDQRARDHIIYGNVGLVISISRRFMNCGISKIDLVQEGIIGMMKALPKYNPHRGASFATYASWWIMSGMREAINEKRTDLACRVPIRTVRLNTYISKIRDELRFDLRREPYEEEMLSAMAGKPIAKAWFPNWKCQPRSGAALSFSTPLNDNQTIGDILAATEDHPEEAASREQGVHWGKAFRAEVERLIATLRANEQTILRQRFGLHGDAPMTLEEIGAQRHLTRERIRQIEKKILLQLAERLRLTYTQIREALVAIGEMANEELVPA